jgi:hypothetical protein
VNVKQPAGEAGLYGVQCIAGRDVQELRHHRPGDDLNRACEGGTAFERRLKSRGRDLQCGPGHADNRSQGGSDGSERRHEADDAVVADHGGCGRLSVRQLHDEGDRAAAREAKVLDPVPRSNQDCIVLERYFPEIRCKQSEVGRR